MIVPLTVDRLARVNPEKKDIHLVLGMFDGVHRGHQALIESAIQAAKQKNGLAGVFTFWPHPSRILRPESPTPQIFEERQKHDLLRKFGIDLIIQQEFTIDFSRIEAKPFIASLKEHIPTLKAVYVGENFRFGRNRAGGAHFLVEEARNLNFQVYTLERLKYNGKTVSSTRIRACLQKGQMEEVNRMLGFPYYCRGDIQAGNQIGRKLGFPTLNVPWEPELKPRFGVYHCLVTRFSTNDEVTPSPSSSLSSLPYSISDTVGEWYPAVGNYGVRPTVTEKGKPILELHLLDSNKANFGQKDAVEVRWLRFARAEKKFGSRDELEHQIAEDKAGALRAFNDA